MSQYSYLPTRYTRKVCSYYSALWNRLDWSEEWKVPKGRGNIYLLPIRRYTSRDRLEIDDNTLDLDPDLDRGNPYVCDTYSLQDTLEDSPFQGESSRDRGKRTNNNGYGEGSEPSRSEIHRFGREGTRFAAHFREASGVNFLNGESSPAWWKWHEARDGKKVAISIHPTTWTCTSTRMHVGKVSVRKRVRSAATPPRWLFF